MLQTAQGNIPDTALTDVNGRKIIFEAIDDLDNGLNGTIGMSYSLKGDGKFESERGFTCAPANSSLILPEKFKLYRF